MSHKLAARFTATKATLLDRATAKNDQEGLTTIEWALVTLMVCAFAVTALGILSSFGVAEIGKLIKNAFGGKA
ncbi:DUF4244 domain-containing protein [Nostocoides australiense]|nr:DUF4244 domain-containing protein [Actinomycetota bacterium]MCB1255094.1 DUF4244 domain-containing protein [Austwickia sp.]HPF79765.1 DUF4244 domain-containing protein [Tetrasphaera australiensis]HRW00662.1 DUF4244 domain-containing protein [Tetrasphaera sp.]